MKKGALLAAAAVLGGFLVLAGWSPKREKSPLLLTKNDLEWGLGPDAFPMGVRATIVEGDPDQDERFTMRLKFPRRYRITPCWVEREQRITVLSGSIALGVGDRYDAKQLKTYPAGSYLVIPERTRYYLKSDRGALLELHGRGPWDVHYVERADDPRLQAASL